MKLTKQDVINEIIKCGKDVNYFLDSYAKIQTIEHGMVDFKLFDYQKQLNLTMLKNRYVIVLKARQLGISTDIAGYILWLCLFHKDKNVVIVSNKQKSSRNVMKKCKIMYSLLPDWLKVSDLVVDNKNELEFSNRSKINAETTTMDTGVSDSISLLLVDEAAIIENFDELWGAIYPTISTGGRCVMVSTPRGVGSVYHTLWTKAVNHDNEFVPVKLMWDARPDRDQAWFDKETRNMTDRKKAREYLCSFEQSGDTFFNSEVLDFLAMQTSSTHDFFVGHTGVHIFKRAEINKKYILCGDVARGDGTDNSAFHILDVETREQVAEFEGQVPTDKFSNLCKAAAETYNNAVIIIENNSYGWAVLQRIKDLGYTNIYYSCKGKYRGGIGTFAFEGRPGYVIGMATEATSREIMMDKLEEYIRNKQIRIYGSRTVEEMKSFIWKSGKPKAQKGCNDDLILALAFGIWMLDTYYGKSANSQENMDSLLANSITVSKTQFKDIKDEYEISGPANMMDKRPLYFGLNSKVSKADKKNRDARDISWLLND